MESYYSRDEQVAWGAVTPKEIQDDFQGTTRKPRHRHTDFGHYMSAPTEMKSLDDKQLHPQVPDASVASVYFTPDDSLQVEATGKNLQVKAADKNLLFLEKLSQVIDEDKSDMESTGYATALDNTNTLKSPQINNTLMSIAQNPENNRTHLDNVSISLVENTISLSSDDEFVGGNFTGCGSVNSDEVIVISDEPFSDNLDGSQNQDWEGQDSDLDQGHLLPKIEFVTSNNQSLDSQPDSSSSRGDEVVNFVSHTRSSSSENCKESFAESSVYEDETNELDEACGDLPKIVVTSATYTAEPGLLESSFSDTESDLHRFNDTLEEMEMALKHGLDYVMPGDIPVKSPSADSSIISGSLCQTPHHFQENKREVKLPKSQLGKFAYVQSPVGDYIRKTPNTATFKLPTKPIRPKPTPTPKSPQFVNKHLKNIVSPVGVYIKNSPGVFLKQNVPLKEVARLKLFETTPEEAPSNKENIACDLPQVIYRPAKKTVTHTQKETKLPPNIQQFVSTPPVITTHVRRVKETNLSQTIVSQKLLDGDLTSASIDSSLLDATNTDVSFLLSKQAFIK